MDKDIYIILPYKESLDPNKAGAVSIYVKDAYKYSKFREKIKVISSDDFSNSKLFRNKSYINKFCKKYKNTNISIIEIHNRPEYVSILKKNFPHSKLILTYHNDPQNLRGSITSEDRKKLLEICTEIVFISNWIKRRFFENVNSSINSNNRIIYHGTNKKKINQSKKLKQILFVGKLNENKGYDVFVKVAEKFKKNNPEWNFIAIGNESRKKIFPDKNIVNEIGYKSNKDVLNFYEKSEIAIGNSKWDEPLGRIAIEASSRKCCPIISNVGGLIESKDIAIVLKENSPENIIKILNKITRNKKKLRKLQTKFFDKNNFNIFEISKQIDQIRSQILFENKSLDYSNLKILHITNFNERFDGRLHYNTSKRLNNGFIRNGHNVLTMSDRDITYYNKSIIDPQGVKKFNNKVIKTFLNFRPDVIVLGHADTLLKETVIEIKKIKNVKFCQWFLDPLIKTGPDFLKNKKRIKNLENYIDATFLTTDPKSLNFNLKNSFFIPNPSDISFEHLDNSKNKRKNDLFFAMSHGVHRGKLKKGKSDDREKFLNEIEKKLKGVDFDFYGYKSKEPIWADNFLKTLNNYDMGLNLSRGNPIKFYSSDRIVQIIGNGLLCFINEKTELYKLIPKNCAIYYKNTNDLVKKINFYKNNITKMKKIAKNGMNFYNKYYNSTLVSQFILDYTLNSKKKFNYLWYAK